MFSSLVRDVACTQNYAERPIWLTQDTDSLKKDTMGVRYSISDSETNIWRRQNFLCYRAKVPRVHYSAYKSKVHCNNTDNLYNCLKGVDEDTNENEYIKTYHYLAIECLFRTL